MLKHELYMRRCIQLALKGSGKVAPNPMVGAVIVHNDTIIGEGYHERFGQAHAEVNAINNVTDKSLLKEATIYVSLEPCAHFGKTPPCANLIVESGIRRVVIGSRDPHSEVDGKGIQILKNNGIEVTTGVLEEECRAINQFFFTFHEKKRPYVFLKWAQSEDGFMDKDFEQTQISCEESKSLVHQWRSEYQSILVGRKTVETDNPSLTVRYCLGNNPIRIVIDPELTLDRSLNIFDGTVQTYIFNLVKNSEEKVRYVKLEQLTIEAIVHKLYELNINSVLVEGGATTLQKFIDAELWDTAKVFISDRQFKNGTKAPAITTVDPDRQSFFEDELLTYVHK